MVAGSPGDSGGTALAVVALDASLEIVALDEEFGVLAGIDAVAGRGAREVVVEHVDLAHTGHRHALLAACAPPVEGEGGVEIACGLAVAAADEVGVLVHV